MNHTNAYMNEVKEIAHQFCLVPSGIDSMVAELVKLRERRGRLFFIGLGGSAANCSHAVNDFRRLCGIEAFCATDNAAEFTAAVNDDGWKMAFAPSFWNKNDAAFVLSVGGGTESISQPIAVAVQSFKQIGNTIFGIVGRDGGYTKKYGDHVIIIPTVEPSRVTPHTEAFQSVVLHCIVSHPDLQIAATKW